MKQLLQNLKNGQTTVEDVPVPTPHEGMALVKVAASLVSAGTERMLVEFAEKNLVGKARSRPDLVRQVLDKAKREGLVPTVQAAFIRLDQPMPLGYSSAGTILALGKNMRGFRVGQRVACAGLNYAVHAEYNLVPRNLLAPIPKNVDFESAAFTTLAAIAMQGFRLAEPQIGENLAVIGMGLLGLLTAQIAASAGCNVLGIDVDPNKVRLASSLGVESVARKNAESTAQTFTANRGFDVVIICAATASNDPVELAGAIARDRGRVVATGAVGLSIPRKVYYDKELSFINSRSYGPGRYDPSYEEKGVDYPIGYVRWTEGRNMESVLQLMADGKLKVHPLITHRIPIGQAASAYEIITGKKKESFLGVLLTYSEEKKKEEGKVFFPSTVYRPASRINLGVLGAGNFANAVLLPAIKKAGGISLVGIASAGGMHAQVTGRKFGFQYAASSEDEILGDPNINTIAILTRHNSHTDLAIKAMKAGRNVFVEKPLAITSSQLSLIHKQLLKTNNCLLMTGFNRRFSPLAQTLSDFLSPRTEPLHVHYRVNAGTIPPNHWTQDETLGGGRIIGEACHFIDLVTFLVGAPPVSVSAHALPDLGRYREDNVSMTLTFPDGSIGVVDYLANGDKSFPKERLEVFCAGTIAVLDDFRVLQMIKDGSKKEEKRAQDKGWVNEWKAFSASIREAGAPPIPYEQLIGVTRATFAAVESIRTGRIVSIS